MSINGLPAHPLFVHLAVVVIPLAAVLGIVAVVWPAARVRLGIATPLVALVAMVITPLTTSAGETLEKQVRGNADLARHAALGDQMIAWVAPLFVFVLVFWVMTDGRFLARLPRPLSPVLMRSAFWVVSAGIVIAGVGAVIMTVLVGEAGARSVWVD